MRRKYYEFMVKGIVQVESGRLHVIGRCGDFPIRIQSRFDRAFSYQPRKYPEEAGRPPVRAQEKKIDLSVVCIHVYDRSLSELGEGMTGSLILEGDGIDQVVSGWILGSIEDHSSLDPPMLNPTEETVVS